MKIGDDAKIITETMLNESLLKKIKKARLVKGLKQEDMAEQLRISTPTYSRFERGITKTNYNLLKKVCAILNIDFYEIQNEQVDFFNEELITYKKFDETDEKKRSAIDTQLKKLIRLLEKQQKTNAILLKYLKSLV